MILQCKMYQQYIYCTFFIICRVYELILTLFLNSTYLCFYNVVIISGRLVTQRLFFFYRYTKYVNTINFAILSRGFYAKYNRFRHYEANYAHVIPYPEYKTQSFQSVARSLLDPVHPFRNDETAAIVVACKFAAIV